MIQLIMVALLIVFPQMSLVYKTGDPDVDPSKLEIIIPQEQNAPAADAYPGQEPAKPEDPDKAMQDAFKPPPAESPRFRWIDPGRAIGSTRAA